MRGPIFSLKIINAIIFDKEDHYYYCDHYM